MEELVWATRSRHTSLVSSAAKHVFNYGINRQFVVYTRADLTAGYRVCHSLSYY